MKNRMEQAVFPKSQTIGWVEACKRRSTLYGVSGWRAISGRNINRRFKIEPESWGREHLMLQRAFTALRAQQGMSLEEAAEKMYLSVPEVKAVEKGVLQLAAGILAAFL